MPKSNRVTKIEKERRERQVQDWLIEGRSDLDIIADIKKEWQLSRKQADKYLKTAYDGFRKDNEITIESKRASKIAELKALIRGMDDKYKSTPAGVNAINRVQKQIIRLDGTEMPKQHQVEANVNTIIKPTKYIDATSRS